MIYKETITLWKSIKPVTVATTGTEVVLNTNRINSLQVRSSTKSKFFYSLNPWRQREAPAYIEAETANSTIVNQYDDTLSSNIFAMPELPGEVITATPVTRNIDWSDFAYAVAYDDTRSYVYWTTKGFNIRRSLVDYNLDQIVDVAGTGTTSTTSE